MRIRLIDIKGFGKFINKRIHPADGFNLIMGPNEAGKSTLADFVTAMLYGLGSGKRSRKTASGRNFRPWASDRFAGVMEYVLDDGSAYRVDRNFDKGLVHVYDGMSRDITSRFASDRNTGPRFAEEQLGLSEEVFIRSARIRQMQTAMDPDGARIILEKLANLSATGSEDQSLGRALEALENALLERVGTERSTTRPLDRVEARLKELERMKADWLERHERYLDTWSMLRQEEDRLRELKQRHEALKARYQLKLKERLDALARECREIDRSLDEMKAALTELERRLERSGIFGEMTDRAMEALTNTWFAYQETRKQLAECESGIKALEQEYAGLSARLEKLQPMREKVERIDRRLREQDESFREAAASAEGRKSGGRIPLAVPVLFLTAAALILVLPAVLHLDLGMPWLYAAGVLALTGVFTALLRVLTKKSVLTDAADRQLKMLYGEGFTGLNDYLSQKETLQGALADFERCGSELEEWRKKRVYLAEKKETLFKSLASCLDGFRTVTDNPESVDEAMEAFRSGFSRFREDDNRAHELRQRMESLVEKRRLLLREASALTQKEMKSAADLEAAARQMAHGEEQSPLALDGKAQEQDIRATEEAIRNCEVRIGSLYGRLENAPSQDELADMEEEILRLAEKKRELELAGRSLRTARDILKEVGSQLQMNYTAQLNSEMSRFLSVITNGRYQHIRTDPEGRLYLEVPECEELVPVERLSSGTIDQVYFSMRLAALALLERGKETLPLFLDEPFLQYDEDRIRQAFRLMKEASANRQVFFMTSRKRELELARELWGDALNVIQL